MSSIGPKLLSESEYGQSLWLDFVSHDLLISGQLQNLILEKGICGLTSNPIILEKSISGTQGYDQKIEKLSRMEKGSDPYFIYEKVSVEEIQLAADILRPVYDKTSGLDGLVSLEVSPHLAHQTQGTIEQALRIWDLVNRPNLMVKVPGTNAGFSAVRELTALAINVNVTLLFSIESYIKCFEAYYLGLESRKHLGLEIRGISSVASFFISRIDTKVDALIATVIQKTRSESRSRHLKRCLGKIAISNAKMAYDIFKKSLETSRWRELEQLGAQPQRLLWASTGTKNPAYSDVYYVEELIGPNTINTLPPATLEAFTDHGIPRLSLTVGIQEAEQTLKTLEEIGISLAKVSESLLQEGLVLFQTAFDKLIASIDKRIGVRRQEKCHSLRYYLPQELQESFKKTSEAWRKGRKTSLLWAKNKILWTGSDEDQWLGWLDIVSDSYEKLNPRLLELSCHLQKLGIRDCVLLGMGGSSLGPEVLAKTFESKEGSFPKLHILDSTHPDKILHLERQLDLKRTFFIVSSKSGSTLETNLLMEYFFEKSRQCIGGDRVGQYFIAITDPGSPLRKTAEKRAFFNIFDGVPSIGGRYSVLSLFGLVPGYIIGIELNKFLVGVRDMGYACSDLFFPDENPGVLLGILLAASAQLGRHQVTIVTSPLLSHFGGWAEQLLAESLGKDSKGVLPIVGEVPSRPENYGMNRLFVYLYTFAEKDAVIEEKIRILELAGHPTIEIQLPDAYSLGAEFFRWEIATAVAGSVMKVNPFNQPNVESSKVETRKLTEEIRLSGRLRQNPPLLKDGAWELSSDQSFEKVVREIPIENRSCKNLLRAQFNRCQQERGESVALLAYCPQIEPIEKEFQKMRVTLQEKFKFATTLGYGPRFLHSTGQYHKGGPHQLVFVQFTHRPKEDIPITNEKFNFGESLAAQAQGDFEVLRRENRRVLNIHFEGEVLEKLAELRRMVESFS